jgi:signal transduction histidine kinase
MNAIKLNSLYHIPYSWGKSVVLLILFVLSNSNCFSQNAEIDSLKKALILAKHDTTKCNILFELSDLLPDGEWQKANDDLVALSKKSSLLEKNASVKKVYISLYAYSIGTKAYEQTQKGNYSDVILNLYLESLSNFEKVKDLENIARLHNNIGLHFYFKGDYKTALLYYQKALAFTRKTKNDKGSIYLINNIASIYHDSKDYKQALTYYKECLSLSKLVNDGQSLANVYNNISAIYSNTKNLDSALYYNQKSIDVSISTDDYKNLGTALSNMGAKYYEEKDYTKALNYYNKSLEVNLKHHFKANEAYTYLQMSKLWLGGLKENNKAEMYALKALNIGKEIASLDLINRASELLIEIYKVNHKYKEALEMTDLYNSTSDSINNKEAQKALIQNQVKYEYDAKALTDSLKTVNDKAVLSLQIEKDKTQKLFLYVLIGLAIAFAVFIFNRFRVNNKQKILIENANQKLEMANKDLGRQHTLNQKIFSVISHDFRGPILSLKLLLESFNKKNKDEVLNTYVNEVNNEVTNANDMLNNLLNWARTELNIKDFDKTNSNVLAIYTSTINEFEQKLKNKNLTVNAIISKDSIIELPPDIVRITLRNLISNAIKFSFENNSIQILFDEKTASLSVTDFGKGMDEQLKNKLFKKEVDTELGTNNEEGFGMGLYILHELLHKYNYKIAVESELNKGSRFTITKK